MKVEIKVPAMGESITEATVGEILVQNGTQVKADDEILELETDKVNQVLFAPEAGVLQLDVAEGDTVTIGQVLGFVDGDGKAAPAPAKEEVKEEAPSAPEPKEEAPKPATAPAAASGGSARMGKEAFLADVKENKAPSAPAASAPSATAQPKAPSALPGDRETRKKLTNVRKVIARRLVEVQHNTAMLTTFNEVDLTQVMSLRSKYRDAFEKKYGVRLGFMSFFVKAAVSALKLYPEINAYIDGDDMVQRNYYDVGIAVGTDKGLFVPVLRNCDQMSFADVELSIREYAVKARDRKITADDLQGGGFTITNGGVYGSLLSTPILNPPQSGILGMHKIEKRPVVVNDEIVIRPMMYLAMSYDHRIVDGKGAVSFLVHIKECLEDPNRLVLDI